MLEYDLLTRELVWSYEGDPGAPGTEFYSGTASSVHRLPNGNTLIVVTHEGRAIEVTRDKQVVWEFFNPARAGKDDELAAALFHLERVPAVPALEWLSSSGAGAASGQRGAAARHPGSAGRQVERIEQR